MFRFLPEGIHISNLQHITLFVKNRDIFYKNRIEVKVLQRCPSARRERYIGEGGFACGEQATQRLSYADFFGYFLVRYKKVTLPQYDFVNSIITIKILSEPVL